MITIPEIQDIIMSNNPHSYYHIYKQYEQNYWKHIPNWILEHVKKNEINNILDIGCAYGTLLLFTKKLTNCNVYGIDFMKYISDDLINKYNINYKINNIELDEFPWDTKFDIVLFTEIFEHLNLFCIPTLLKIKNLLSDNGVILFSTPSSEFWGRLNNYASWKDMPRKTNILKDNHIYVYGANELKEIFNICKLKINKWELSSGFNNLKHFNIQLSKK